MENPKYFDKQLTSEDMIGLGGELLEMKKKNLIKQNRPSKA